jgi:hypothetical protein
MGASTRDACRCLTYQRFLKTADILSTHPITGKPLSVPFWHAFRPLSTKDERLSLTLTLSNRRAASQDASEG